MTPAEELEAASRALKESTEGRHAGAVSTVAALIRARGDVAALLDAATRLATAYPEMAHDHDRAACDDYACDVMGRAINLARVINGQPDGSPR
ncbi:hypothetical protein ACFWIB_14560 [Streptomyces sp. NPDC127051]|uniref:hypothetical protein n=1 Tax=Streptomyces sp. NPDC127051 TaxID=3347119 RepID=UPI0036672088